MSSYITRHELLAALTGTHERTITPRLFGGRKVLIRELTARQRLMAQEGATAENPDAPDNALYRAMLVQMSVVDPESGDARDPRTRTPLLTIDDVQSLANGRDVAMTELVDAIVALSALGPVPLFRGDRSPDRSQRDADAGEAIGGDAADQDAHQGTGDDDGRTDVPAEPGAAGDEPASLE